MATAPAEHISWLRTRKELYEELLRGWDTLEQCQIYPDVRSTLYSSLHGAHARYNEMAVILAHTDCRMMSHADKQIHESVLASATKLRGRFTQKLEILSKATSRVRLEDELKRICFEISSLVNVVLPPLESLLVRKEASIT